MKAAEFNFAAFLLFEYLAKYDQSAGAWLAREGLRSSPKHHPLDPRTCDTPNSRCGLVALRQIFWCDWFWGRCAALRGQATLLRQSHFD